MTKLPGGIPEGLRKLLEGAAKAGAEVKVMDMGTLTLDREEDKKKGPLPEARVMELQLAAKLYAEANPYKVGDIVTPRRNSGLVGHGIPHIVVEIMPEDEVFRAWDGNPSGGNYGQKVTIRVLGIKSDGEEDRIVPWWGEHFQYEPFDVAKDYEVDD